MGDIELPDDDPVQCGSEFCVICNELATGQYSWNVDSQNRVKATITVRVTVSCDCPVYDSPDFDCVIKTRNHGTAAPHFLAHAIVVKQLDGSACHLVWTMEVCVGPDHIVLDGNPAPP